MILVNLIVWWREPGAYTQPCMYRAQFSPPKRASYILGGKAGAEFRFSNISYISYFYREMILSL